MGVAYNVSPIVRDGLVLCLDAANPKSYPGTGTTWYDFVGQRSGTLLNSPVFSDNYFSMDGVNQAVSFASSVEVSTGDGFTICTLIRLPATQINGVNWCYFVVDRDFGAGDYESGIYNINNTTWIFKENASSPNSISASMGTEWRYLCYGQNSLSQPFIYLDGAAVASSTSTWPSATLDFVSIFSRDNTSGFLKCDCSAIQIYDRGLSVDEAQQNFTALRGRFGI